MIPEFLEKAFKFAERKERARNLDVSCPRCKTKQVQLVDYVSNDKILYYKCRRCHATFSIED